MACVLPQELQRGVEVERYGVKGGVASFMLNVKSFRMNVMSSIIYVKSFSMKDKSFKMLFHRSVEDYIPGVRLRSRFPSQVNTLHVLLMTKLCYKNCFPEFPLHS